MDIDACAETQQLVQTNRYLAELLCQIDTTDPAAKTLAKVPRWSTQATADNVVVATMVGIAVLLFGDSVLDSLDAQR